MMSLFIYLKLIFEENLKHPGYDAHIYMYMYIYIYMCVYSYIFMYGSYTDSLSIVNESKHDLLISSSSVVALNISYLLLKSPTAQPTDHGMFSHGIHTRVVFIFP